MIVAIALDGSIYFDYVLSLFPENFASHHSIYVLRLPAPITFRQKSAIIKGGEGWDFPIRFGFNRNNPPNEDEQLDCIRCSQFSKPC